MKFSHVPAWGFGKAKKCEIEKTDPLFNPGPGHYAPRKGGNGPTWRIGSALRGSKNLNNNLVQANIIFQIKYLMAQNIQWPQKQVVLILQKLLLLQGQGNIMLLQKIGQVVQNIQ